MCVYLVFSFFSFSKRWECYTGKAVHASIINSAISALYRFNQVCTHNSTPPLHFRSPRNTMDTQSSSPIVLEHGMGMERLHTHLRRRPSCFMTSLSGLGFKIGAQAWLD